MQRHPLLVAILAAALLLAGAPVGARGQEGLPEAGSWGVAFAFPDGGGGTFGVRHMLSPTVNLGVDVDVGVSWAEDALSPDGGGRTGWELGLSPNLRLYQRTLGPVVPFLGLGLASAYRDPAGSRWDLALALRGGVGAEWFPLASAGLAGWTGLSARYTRSARDGYSSEAIRLGTFRSELTLNLYF